MGQTTENKEILVKNNKFVYDLNDYRFIDRVTRLLLVIYHWLLLLEMLLLEMETIQLLMDLMLLSAGTLLLETETLLLLLVLRGRLL